MRSALFLRYSLLAAAALLAFSGFSLQATTLSFSGSITGNAVEDPLGRCAPLITVNATGSGSSNLLGNFTDTQSHCTTSLTTFGDGLFTLTSTSTPVDSLSGTYSGTASLGSGGVLDFAATLTINGGSGDFAGASGTLGANGTLSTTGAFAASFSGSVSPAPEPAPLLTVPGILALLACLRRRRASQARLTSAYE